MCDICDICLCNRKITEDNECGLFAVTMFRKVVDEYKLHCRENKFVLQIILIQYVIIL